MKCNIYPNQKLDKSSTNIIKLHEKKYSEIRKIPFFKFNNHKMINDLDNEKIILSKNKIINELNFHDRKKVYRISRNNLNFDLGSKDTGGDENKFNFIDTKSSYKNNCEKQNKNQFNCHSNKIMKINSDKIINSQKVKSLISNNPENITNEHRPTEINDSLDALEILEKKFKEKSQMNKKALKISNTLKPKQIDIIRKK